jgi:DNA-binding transcriptional regulator YdaS (Cro superfamily)
MEKLRKYILKNSTVIKFADALGVERNSVYNWFSGRRTPKPSVARDIVKLTRGEVTLQDIYASK